MSLSYLSQTYTTKAVKYNFISLTNFLFCGGSGQIKVTLKIHVSKILTKNDVPPSLVE